jgi:hypothetical protein
MRKFSLFAFLVVAPAAAYAGPVIGGPAKALLTASAGASCTGNGQVGDPDTGSALTGRVNDVFYFSSFTATSAGTVNYAHVKFSANSGTNKFAIYDSGGNRLAFGSANGGSGTGERIDFTLNTSVCLTGGSVYYIGVTSTDTSYSLFQDTGTGARRTIAMSASSDPAATLDVGSSTLQNGSQQYIMTVNNITNAYQ